MFSSISSVYNNQLATLIYFTTSRCNARCQHCYNYQNLNKNIKEELTAAEISLICKNLKRLLLLQCSGGEPFLKEDIGEILSNFALITRAINIPTNGFLPRRIEKETALLVKKHPETIFRISLSIDGIGSLHDEMRNVPGGYNLVTETFSRLAKLRAENRNMFIAANTVFNKQNEQFMPDIIDSVHRLGIDYHTITYIWGEPSNSTLAKPSLQLYRNALRQVSEKRYGQRTASLAAMVMKSIYRTSDSILIDIHEKNKMILPCRAAKKFAILSPTGEVSPCHLKTESLGNVKENHYNIPAILKNSASKKIRREMQDSKCFCTVQCDIRNNVLYNITTAYYMIKYAFSNSKSL